MSNKPVRLQRSRRKGSHLVSPNGLPIVNVSRPSKYGNPYETAYAFRHWLAGDCPDFMGYPEQRAIILRDIEELRGKNLACWCKLCSKHSTGKPPGVSCTKCAPCHSDILLTISNARKQEVIR